MANQKHNLTLGSLSLTEGETSTEGYRLSVYAEGASFGTPQAVVKQIVSALADGDAVTYDRAGNRQVQFQVEIHGDDGLSLAAGEVALRSELYRPNAVTWIPPAEFGPASVYEVITSEMSPQFNDIDELRTRRVFQVTLGCAPFAQSASPVVVPALTATGAASTITVDACDSATGWTSAGGGDTVSQSAGAVWVADAVGGNNSMSLRRSAAIDVSVHPYFSLEWKPFPGSGYTIMGMSAADNPFPKEARRVALPDGWLRSFWTVAPGDLDSGFQFSYVNTDAVTTSGDTLGIREVVKSNLPPGTTARQLTRNIATVGTERTPASIHVQSANGTTALDHVIVHTCPEDGSGYSPPLQRWRTVGQTRTADATAFSGNYESINTTSWIAEVPTSALPEGGYSLLARLRCQTASTVTITWSTSTIFPDSVTQQGFTVGTVTHTFAAANAWEIIPMDVLSLPSVRTKAGKVQIALQVAAASPVVTLDEALLLREGDDCATTIVKTDRAHLWLESPDLASLVPTVWVGSDVVTRVHPGEGLVAQGTHVLSAGGTAVFTAALTDYPLTDALYSPRWHSNAAV